MNVSRCLHINYNSCSSDLCELGRKYDTDKSSQRNNVTNYRHCHPYTLFYENLFRNNKNDHLKIAELGILDGASLRMWQEYFTNSEIHGFEYNTELIDRFKKNFNNDRITLEKIDVTDKNSVANAFSKMDAQYDIVIEDTTHQFEDQIRVIENMYQYVKPGGILIIEDIFKSYNENDYINRLQPILHLFQDYFFVELDHVNRVSTGWNNDKLFILVKGGGEPIFKNQNKITIITPSYRIDNTQKLKDSINFDYVDEWIIVYDQTRISENPNLFKNSKIKEYIHMGRGISGNPQRNYAMTKVTNPGTMIYYLDDDNLINPSIYKLFDVIDNTKIYTFNQLNRLKGNDVRVGGIDTAMFIVPYSLCKNKPWLADQYAADGMFIEKCYEANKKNHIFVDDTLCYYNKLI
jgi:predicted O-methyltransferase YrrM